MSKDERAYRLVLYDGQHKVADARAFWVGDDTKQVHVTVGDKRFTLLMPPVKAKQETEQEGER